MARKPGGVGEALVALLAASIFALLKRVPLSLARPLGRLIGAVSFRFFHDERQRAIENLARIGGGSLRLDTRRHLARRVFQNLGQSFVDTLITSRLGTDRAISSLGVEGAADLRERFEELSDEGRGVIVVSAHLGNWELEGGLLDHCYPRQVICIARRYERPYQQRLLERLRAGIGTPLRYQDESVRELLRLLKGGGLVGLLPDIDIRRVQGIHIPFLGSPAHTTTAPAQLAISTGAAIQTVFVIRTPRGYSVEIGAVIDPADHLEGRDPVLSVTRAWTLEVERAIRTHPEQWVWMHDRWRSTPEVVERRNRRRASRDEQSRRLSRSGSGA